MERLEEDLVHVLSCSRTEFSFLDRALKITFKIKDEQGASTADEASENATSAATVDGDGDGDGDVAMTDNVGTSSSGDGGGASYINIALDDEDIEAGEEGTTAQEAERIEIDMSSEEEDEPEGNDRAGGDGSAKGTSDEGVTPSRAVVRIGVKESMRFVTAYVYALMVCRSYPPASAKRKVTLCVLERGTLHT